MGARAISWTATLALFCIAIAASAPAQECDDFNPCTSNDACSGALCSGTPQAGGNCDEVVDCTINGRCMQDGTCGGDPAPNGTECAGGCGTCLVLAPGIPGLCSPKPDVQGQDCDANIPCFDGSCQVIAGTIVTCIPAVRNCPDTDGNPCTDACNFETGECEQGAPKCFAPCETCNAGTGQCQPANQGGACDDFNPCTAQSSCQQTSGGGVTRGFCGPGAPIGPTATVTPDNGEATATPTQDTGPTATATEIPTPGECVGDCDSSDEVTLGEVQISFNVFLGTALLDTCDDADADENGEVSLGEVQLAFNAFLIGCE